MKKLLSLSIIVGFMVSGCWSFTRNASATDHPIGKKQGEACSSIILGLFSVGDDSIVKAANRGGISKISTVDQHYSTVFGFLFQTYCTRVTGE